MKEQAGAGEEARAIEPPGSPSIPTVSGGDLVQQRAEALFQERQWQLRQRLDRLFLVLLPVQWFLLIAVAVFLSPRTWLGTTSAPHVHLLAAVILGGILTVGPCLAVRRHPGRLATRLSVTVAQVMMGALLIHLMGGRLEAHFHIFVSLPLLAGYRDFRVLSLATALVAVDHAVRGIWFPESVFGTFSEERWRWLEHGGWVAVEVLFLRFAIRVGREEAREVSLRRAELEATGAQLEERVASRTRDLRNALQIAEDSQRARADFLSHASHELHTPLNGVLSTMEEALRLSKTSEQRHLLAVSYDSAHRLHGLLDDLLEYTRLDAGSAAVTTSRFSLREMVAEVAVGQAVRAHAQELPLSWHVPEAVPDDLQGPAGPLRRMLHALVEEALRARTSGRLAIEIVETRRDERSIALEARILAEGQALEKPRLAGVGDRPEARALGTGLELAMRLGERIGARVSEEEEAHCTSFRLQMVLDRPTSEAPSGEDAAGVSGCVVHLLIEDSAETASLRALLAHGGVDVRGAGDAPVENGCLLIDEGREAPDHLESLAHIRCVPRTLGRLGVLDDRLSLPTTPGELRLALARAREAQRAEERRREVLVVEDNPINQKVVCRLLERLGCLFEVAANGALAVERCANQRFDLVLMDLQMPVMDGLEATRHLRESGCSDGSRPVPIVALTANDSDGDRRACEEVGMDAFLCKPVRVEQLAETIGRFIPVGVS